MHIKENAGAQGWFRRHAAAPSSTGAWKAFVARNKRTQEPRTMAQGGGIIGKPGGLVEPGVMYYGVTKRGPHSKTGYQEKKKWRATLKTSEETIEERFPTKKEAQTFYDKKVAAAKKKGTFRQRGVGNALKINKFKQDINLWTENWINKNINKYEIREFDNFKNDLSKAWLKESKKKKYQIEGVGKANRILTQNNLPAITGTKSFQPFKMFDFTLGGGSQAHQLEAAQRNFFGKIFYKNHLNKNPELVKSFNTYLDYMVADKRNSKNVQSLMKQTGVIDPSKLINDDVVYLLSSDSGLGGYARSELFTDTFGEKYSDYMIKTKRRGGSWQNARNIIKARTGIDITKQLLKENESLKKLFKVTELPEELLYSGDHIFGVSQAAKTGNKKFMLAAIDNLVGMTETQNRFLGMGVFEKERGKLVNKINKAIGSDKAKFVKELNTLMGNTYSSSFPKDTKFYTLDKGKLNINPNLKKLSQGERFMGWATEISKKPTKLLKETFTDPGVLKNMLALKKGDPTKMNKFLDLTSKSMQADLSPQSIYQLKKIHGCGKKAEGGSIMTCLQGKFKADPEKFLQKSAPLAKNNANLFNWFKNGRKIARGTGIALAWEAAFAPIIGGWAALEGESMPRIINEIAYGIPGIGETTKDEFMKYAGGNEKAWIAKRMDEIQTQELPYLEYERDRVINKMAHTEGKSFHQRTIEDDIKEKQLEYQDLWNKSGFEEGPAGGALWHQADSPDAYFNMPAITEADQTYIEARDQIAADKAARKKQRWESYVPWSSQLQMAEGGIASLNVKK